jgi:hypothetical protein
VAERVGFEPTYSLLGRNPISSRTRYDLFGTSPAHESTKIPGVNQTQSGKAVWVRAPARTLRAWARRAHSLLHGSPDVRGNADSIRC